MMVAAGMLGYVGPGTALSALGALLALLLAGVLALVGFVWYPIQRLLRSLRRRPDRDPRSESP